VVSAATTMTHQSESTSSVSIQRGRRIEAGSITADPAKAASITSAVARADTFGAAAIST